MALQALQLCGTTSSAACKQRIAFGCHVVLALYEVLEAGHRPVGLSGLIC